MNTTQSHAAVCQPDAPIHFVVPASSTDFPLPTSSDAYWSWISARSEVESWGPYSWTLQTYLQLRDEGFPCILSHDLPKAGIVVAHRDFLPDSLTPNAETLLVCLLADREQPGLIGHHPFAQYHIVQNPVDAKLTDSTSLWPASYLPYWPQPGLVPREARRGARFDTAGYFGYQHNLAPELRAPSWAERMQREGFHWMVPHRADWHDFRSVDVIVAVREYRSIDRFSYKPPSKLINAWHAGVPAVLGPESAYRACRRSELDYLEAETPEETLRALRRLRDDLDLRHAMIRAGALRAEEFSIGRTRRRWIELLSTSITRAHAAWCAATEPDRASFLEQRARARAGKPTAPTAVRLAATRPDEGAEHRYDVAILGSGFAAYEMARTVSARGKRVIVLERGPAAPLEPDIESPIKFRREPIVSGAFRDAGMPTGEPSARARLVALGGTSELWAGKWRRLDAIDLSRERDGRTWPFEVSQLQPDYARVAADWDVPRWSGTTPSLPGDARIAAAGLRAVEIFDDPQPVRLRPRWQSLMLSGAVTVQCEATVVGALATPDGDAITGLRVSTPEQVFEVRADQFVVACGGIASVSASHAIRSVRRDRGLRLPERYGGFMDHPKAPFGVVRPTWGRGIVDELLHAHGSERRLRAFSLPEDELRTHQLGNHAVFLWPQADHAGESSALTLVLSAEQFPEEPNAVIPGPHSEVTWRVSRATRLNCQLFLERLMPRLSRLLGPVEWREPAGFRGASHHIGALPMGHAGVGIVDEHCRFHDVHNLYCVSSAVFPLGGSANPTMTILALARRLADRLVPASHE